MDQKLSESRHLIKTILTQYADLLNRRPKPNRETVTVFDDTNAHYLLHTMGWQDEKRIWNTIVYVRLQAGKFWIEEDGLERGLATDLLAAEVPNEHIVLAFHHPKVRPYTEFAVS